MKSLPGIERMAAVVLLDIAVFAPHIFPNFILRKSHKSHRLSQAAPFECGAKLALDDLRQYWRICTAKPLGTHAVYRNVASNRSEIAARLAALFTVSRMLGVAMAALSPGIAGPAVSNGSSQIWLEFTRSLPSINGPLERREGFTVDSVRINKRSAIALHPLDLGGRHLFNFRLPLSVKCIAVDVHSR
jgi:hypothetical protein